ncbi:MAG TPA: hypothetical protein VGG39_17015 [Polyangiaceae bacterium]
MNLSTRNVLALVLAAGAVGVSGALAACSSSNSGSGGFGGDASTGGEGGSAGSCANPTVPIIFSPMYSAYVPGATLGEKFQIPAVTDDGNSATWSASDPSQVNLQDQSFDVGGDTQQGTLITIAGTGDSQGHVTIYATESDGSCGAAVLTITKNTDSDYTIGQARYNNGNNLVLRPLDGGRPEGGGGFPGDGGGGGGGGGGGFGPGADSGSFLEIDGGPACTSCHGPTATQFIFKDVAHTPEQTGGFSDQDLQNIILNGQVPDGGYFDPSVLDGFVGQTCDDAGTNVSPDWPACAQKAYQRWGELHQWTDIQTDEIGGVVCYLRSLAPADQDGSSNFGGGGRGPRDGGHGPRDGGGFPHDGGGGGGGGGGSDAGAD